MERGLLVGGRYRLQDRLGVGGMSVVWRARDEVLDRDVAVKVLSADPAADPELMRRIYAEARAAARLRHPNVVAVYDYGETDDGGRPVPYVVMELVGGRSMADLLTGGPLPWRSAVLIAAQVGAALAAAHAHGIVHRDVKPSNVMVTASGVKLVDFGISAAVGEADGSGGELLGTPAYLAPERLDRGQVRPATDVYALGLLLYLALAGHLPWTASTTTEMIRAHRHREPSALPPVPGLPPDVAELCHRCLAKHPQDRPGAADAAEALGLAVGLPPASLLLDAVTAEESDAGMDTEIAAMTADPGTSGVSRPSAVLLAGGVVALLTLGAAAAWSAGNSGDDRADQAAAAAPVAKTVTCAVDYTVRSAVGGRSSTAVTIRNTGDVAVDAWRLTFALPGRQSLIRGWNNRWQQTGVDVQARGGALPAGGSVATGFEAQYRDAAALPAQFLLNGTACQSALSIRNQKAPATTTAAYSGGVKGGKPDDAGKGRSHRGKGRGDR
jgi:eukaryotic-like serine/threonine-protein kinase